MGRIPAFLHVDQKVPYDRSASLWTPLLAITVLFFLGRPADGQTPKSPALPGPQFGLPAQALGVATGAQPGIPASFRPWWRQAINERLVPQGQIVPVAPDGLVLAAVAHSSQVQIFRDTVAVRQSAIEEADGRFDPRAFAEASYRNTDDPVGNTLTTGGPPRWLDTDVHGSGGIRKLVTTGGSLEVSQRMGYEDSNSLYFVPPYQGTARLALSFTQPLLNGAGKAYNCSTTVLAEIRTDAARDQFSKDLQSLVVDIHKAYWELYLQRAALIQRRRLYGQAITIRDELRARQGVDVLRGQIVRAEAAVANRQAALIRFRTGIQNAEARICALVHDPALQISALLEMFPKQKPLSTLVPADLNTSLVTALHSRPEIQQGMREIRAASVRADVAANEVLPTLDAVFSMYVSGLRGYGQVWGAYGDQFTYGGPSYTGGLQFEMPLGGNRSARSRVNQRRLELRQATCQLETTTANIRAEVEIAVNDVDAAYREMVSKCHAIIANEAEIEYLNVRWRDLPGDQQNAGFALDELLSAQERLAQAEYDYVVAESSYNVALISLGRATGTLMKAEDICHALQQERPSNPCPSAPATTGVAPPPPAEIAPDPPELLPAPAMDPSAQRGTPATWQR